MSRFGIEDMNITVNTEVISSRLKENLKKHREQFEKACDGYQKTMEKWLAQRMEEVRAGETPSLHFGHSQPIDMTKTYETVIDMLTVCVETEIELDQQQFRAYMRDEWDWSGNVFATNSAYIAS